MKRGLLLLILSLIPCAARAGMTTHGQNPGLLMQISAVPAPGGGGTNISFIQGTAHSLDANAITVNLPSNATAGTLAILTATSYQQLLDTPATWTLNTAITTGDSRVYQFYKPNLSAGALSVTVETSNTNSTSLTAILGEYSGANTSTPLNDAAVGSGSGTTATTANMDTTVDGCIIVGSVTHQGATMTITAGTNFTIRHEQENGNTAIPGAQEDRGSGANLAAGTYTASATFGSSTTWDIVAGAFCQ